MPRKEITGFRPGSKAYKKFMTKLYGWGASVVLIGALFKIQHYPGAGTFLIIGLSTEAIIFFFSAFEPVHEELDWTLVYPELEGLDDGGTIEEIEDKGSITEQLDNLLEEAKIGPELMESLGSGLRSLSDQTSKLANISDASVATEDFVQNIRSASDSAENLASATSSTAEKISSSADEIAESYRSTAQKVNSSADEIVESYRSTAQKVNSSADEIVESYRSTAQKVNASADQLAETYSKTASQIREELSIGSESGSSYKDELQKVTQNLSALNASYEMQLRESNEHLEAANNLFAGVADMMKNLEESVEDTRKYKDNMAVLANNLSSLNTVYGNMLTAMNISPARQQNQDAG